MKKIVFVILLGLFIASCNKNTETPQKNAIKEETATKCERTGNELKITAIITVKPEAKEAIMPIFQAVVQGSQAEEGCIYYNLHQDISDSTKFIMQEEWKSQDAINFHNNTEHYKKFVEASKNLVEKLEVIKMKLVY